MSKTNISRFSLIVAAICLIIGITIAQRTNANANKKLDDANTIEQIESYLLSFEGERNKKLQELAVASEAELSKLTPEDQNKKISEFQKISLATRKEIANESIRAGEKILTIAKNDDEKFIAYKYIITNYSRLDSIFIGDTIRKQVEDKKLDGANPEHSDKIKEIIINILSDSPSNEYRTKLDDLIAKLEKEGKYDEIINEIKLERLGHSIAVLSTKFSADKFNKTKSELKKLLKGESPQVAYTMISELLDVAASDNAVAADPQSIAKNVKEFTDFANSEDFSKEADARSELAKDITALSSRLPGAELKLYGRTIDDKDFDWAALRGKVVLVNFTATWCIYCKLEIPNLLKLYEQYHSKGFEIVSVYIFEHGETDAAVSAVKKAVSDEKIPWIIVSEALTEKSKLEKQSEKYNIMGVPTMLLIDKNGKVTATNIQGKTLSDKLAELFDKK
ncbi:MAG: TlpA family protein disulfide reductase [Planctomycetaceae bacterium]|nr:TlpA family protein disulfide reductase [Planctomycetaceae bacterium]